MSLTKVSSFYDLYLFEFSVRFCNSATNPYIHGRDDPWIEHQQNNRGIYIVNILHPHQDYWAILFHRKMENNNNVWILFYFDLVFNMLLNNLSANPQAKQTFNTKIAHRSSEVPNLARKSSLTCSKSSKSRKLYPPKKKGIFS